MSPVNTIRKSAILTGGRNISPLGGRRVTPVSHATVTPVVQGRIETLDRTGRSSISQRT